MEIRLADGARRIWQWDTGLAVACDGPVEQLHMAVLSTGEALVVETEEEGDRWVAPVPDELLQSALPLRVWGVAVDSEGRRVRVEARFPIVPRPKPSDYVYTPTETLSYATLAQRIGELDELTTEAKDNLVHAINEAAQTGSGGGGGLTDDEALEALDECGVVHPAAADSATLFIAADNTIITL